MKKKFYPLPKRLTVALSERAYRSLRDLYARYALSNNYLLTILLADLDAIAVPGELARRYQAFIAEYGAPSPGGMTPRERP